MALRLMEYIEEGAVNVMGLYLEDGRLLCGHCHAEGGDESLSCCEYCGIVVHDGCTNYGYCVPTSAEGLMYSALKD